MAIDGFTQYLLSLKKIQRSIISLKFGETVAMVDSSFVEIEVNLYEIKYNYKGKNKSFLNFGFENGVIHTNKNLPSYPTGCLDIWYFPFYNFINCRNIKFKNIIFMACFVVDSDFSFSFENCQLTDWIFVNSVISIERYQQTRSFTRFKFIGGCNIKKLDIKEELDSKTHGLEYEITEPNYYTLIREPIYNFLYRFKPFKHLGKLLTIHKFKFFRVLHMGSQVRPMYKGSYQPSYTIIDDTFDLKLSNISNYYLIEYVEWYKSYILKVRTIYKSKSVFKSLFTLIEIILTGGWKSSKYIIYSSFSIILLFALFYYINSSSFSNPCDLSSSIYYSIRYFLNVGTGDLNATTFIAKCSTALEGLLGYGYLGLLIYRFSKSSDKKH